MAVPDLQKYYEAVILSKLTKHYSEDYEADWKLIEDAEFSPKTFRELFWTQAKLRPNWAKYSALLKATLRA